MFHINKLIISISAVFLLLAFVPAHSAGVMGEYSTAGDNETFPLLEGVKEKFNRDSLVSVNGARINVLKGTSITPYDSGEDGMLVRLEKGKIFFRIFPEVNVFTLATPHSVIKTPRIVNASDSSIEGSLEVDSEGRTVLRVTRGELELLTSEGERRVSENEVITIARADNTDDQSNHYTPEGTNNEEDSGANGNILPPVIITTAVIGGAVTGAVLLNDDDDGDDDSSGDGVGDDPASRIDP